jgi:hypothetical protein
MLDKKLCAKRFAFLFIAYASGSVQALLVYTHNNHWWVSTALLFLLLLTAIDSWERKQSDSSSASE